MVQLLFSYHQFVLANAEPHLHAVMKIKLCEIFTRYKKNGLLFHYRVYDLRCLHTMIR